MSRHEHPNNFLVFCPNCAPSQRRLQLPGGVIVCPACDTNSNLNITLPNIARVTSVPAHMTVWTVPPVKP